MTAERLPLAFYESLRSETTYAAWLADHPQAAGRLYADVDVDLPHIVTPLAVQVISGYVNALSEVQSEIDLAARLAQTPIASSHATFIGNGHQVALTDLPLLAAWGDLDTPLTQNHFAIMERFVETWSPNYRDRRGLWALWGNAGRALDGSSGLFSPTQRTRAAERVSVAYRLGVDLLRNADQVEAWQAALHDQPKRVFETLLSLPPRAHLLRKGAMGAASVKVEAACARVMTQVLGQGLVPTPEQMPELMRRYPEVEAIFRARDRHDALAQRPVTGLSRLRRRS